MSRQRTVKIKRSTNLKRQLKSNNLLILKIVDPIVQFCIFIYFLYCLDAQVQEPSYRSVLFMLIGWQYLSSFLNLFYKHGKVLRTQRIVYLVANTLYMTLFLYLERKLPEINFGINETDEPYIHLFPSLLMGGALLLAFWYNYICYKEVKSLYEKTYRA